MTFLFSHRGNLTGIQSELENTLDYVTCALNKGFNVVVDAWLVGDSHIAIGTDRAQNPVTLDFLQNQKVLTRARTIETLQYLIENKVHCFMEGKDDYIMTNGGLFWTYPKQNITKNCILTMPENFLSDITLTNNIKCAGICSNRIQEIKNSRDN